MNASINRQCHAAAQRIFGSDAHAELKRIASNAPYHRSSWGELTDSQARLVLKDLNTAVDAAQELVEQAQPGRSTAQQRLKMSAIRNEMNWTWAYVRRLMTEYGVSDWHQLSVDQADHLIQRMTKIAQAMKRRKEVQP